MFDFIIETGKVSDKNLRAEELLPTARYGNKNACYSFAYGSENFKVAGLGKNEEFPEILQQDDFYVLIFGYCFSRLSGAGQTKRLFAKEILQLYQKYNNNIVKHIKGSYVIVVYERKNDKLSVFTDELNIRTVYYAQTNENLLLSSSLSAFTEYLPEYFSTINTKAVLEYALFDFVLTNETFLKNVYTIPPATYFTYKNKKIAISSFWSIFKAFENTVPEFEEQEAFVKINHLLKQNLHAYLSEPEKTAFALTGGYDSRTNLALLNGKYSGGYYYSYGIKGSYDIKFARKVATKLNLNFHPFILDRRFANDFPENALTAIKMGDGLVEMSRANYIHAFKEIAGNYDYILTGLFGSELIKRPTSLGGYIDKNIRTLLFADDFEQAYRQIIEKAYKNACVNKELLKIHEKEIFNDLKSNPYIYNQYPDVRKYFFYMVGWGMRKYFMKEIKAERVFVENLHPYMDIEFIELLLKTPFPWIYNWGKKKNLLDNLKIHKFYAQLMYMNNKQLTNIPTTHAYKPKYLLNKLYLPLLIVQYTVLRRKIKKTGIFNNTELMRNFYESHKNELNEFTVLFHNDKIAGMFPQRMKEFNKLISLQIWMKENNLRLA